MLSETTCPDLIGKSLLFTAKAGFAGKNLSIIFIAIVFSGLITAGCSPTTYVSLTENNRDQIENKIYEYGQNNNEGAEVTLSLQNVKEIKGELLSIRESSVTICTKYSATEEELASLKYPINIVQNDEIKELIIKGNNFVWIGLAIGAATFTGIGIWIGHEFDKGLDTEGGKEGLGIIGFVAGAIVGSIVGYFLSTDDVKLQEIPPGYDLSILKPLARYPGEEPEYLGAME